jgi:hypothetical protein
MVVKAKAIPTSIQTGGNTKKTEQMRALGAKAYRYVK